MTFEDMLRAATEEELLKMMNDRKVEANQLLRETENLFERINAATDEASLLKKLIDLRKRLPIRLS